jgi:ASC-1-like (ASCH) protein
MTTPIHILNLQPRYFTAISSNQKTVEGRLCTPKYAAIQPGDRITFRSNDPSPDGSALEVERIVVSVRVFDSFRAMLEGCGLEACLPGCTSLEEGVRLYKEIYRDMPNGEDEFGVVGIEIAAPA